MSKQLIIDALQHLNHVLPAQAPIQDFVHHNTLHGFQDLSFEQALKDYEALTGIKGYLPESSFREFYKNKRIDDADLTAAFKHHNLNNDLLYQVNDKAIKTHDILQLALNVDFSPISVSQLTWQIEELNALDTVQTDVPERIAAHYHTNTVRLLWEALLNKLDLQHAATHPETLLDEAIEQAEEWLSYNHSAMSIHHEMREQIAEECQDLFKKVGSDLSLRGLVLALTGKDVLDFVRPKLIRVCAALLDEGVSAWQHPNSKQGLYAVWLSNVQYDLGLSLHELPDWQRIVKTLPDNALDAIEQQLTAMAIPKARWQGYLQRVALEISGWAGMINWREQHQNYRAERPAPIQLADFLAIRLVLDRLWLNQLCHDVWQLEAKFSSLQHYFQKNLSEFMVRTRLYQGVLPEYLSQEARNLTIELYSERHQAQHWQKLADLIWAWQYSPMAEQSKHHQALFNGWRLFRLCQHLGLQATHVQALSAAKLLKLLKLIDDFTLEQRQQVWLYAYEHHYREQFLNALRANHGRGRWAVRENRPEAQVIFCMDEREESFRRHTEELNPKIETLGAAGFFGVAMNYQGLDDKHSAALCPVVVTPAHNVKEAPLTQARLTFNRHQKGRKLYQALNNVFLHQGRTNPLVSYPVIDLAAPVLLLGLVAKTVLPKTQHHIVQGWLNKLSPPVATELQFINTDSSTTATPTQPSTGFTDVEQADRVANLLRIMGLTSGFAPIVLLMGHGSTSTNNPHRAAYDCGACSGRHGGANARLFSAMANRPEVRRLLAERDIQIPMDTWFLGAEHNTCNEDIDYYDLDQLPDRLHSAFNKLQSEIQHTQQLSAHERCRRLASAPRNPDLDTALAHIQERAVDFSQVRPELGHATNAAAVVGRRALTQGAFFDRRVFLISYDSAIDPEGTVLENILLAVAPVGAGINLEYYFSSVNSDAFGCGTKLSHNITGLFGIMDGTSSDLRTGLPKQMTEIHEAMRLQLLVEAKNTVLERIYNDQPSVKELIAGGWLHLSSKDPETGEIFIFERGTGFVPWQSQGYDLDIYEKSAQCYKNKTEPVAPALLKQ